MPEHWLVYAERRPYGLLLAYRCFPEREWTGSLQHYIPAAWGDYVIRLDGQLVIVYRHVVATAAPFMLCRRRAGVFAGFPSLEAADDAIRLFAGPAPDQTLGQRRARSRPSLSIH
jgi:hypothetical protein